ncbi:Hypothetical predicted protein [Podarcis lilfordi]|uniref:Uncharacterized protein n=1 Tax=Podarcis lilfordi TaxID=74358 RepID=A0AA35K830_9SAUR|nr:Hypothetical predicted protein [Podarcis lilfordi]
MILGSHGLSQLKRDEEPASTEFLCHTWNMHVPGSLHAETIFARLISFHVSSS